MEQDNKIGRITLHKLHTDYKHAVNMKMPPAATTVVQPTGPKLFANKVRIEAALTDKMGLPACC